MKVGERIRQIRTLRGLTQKELGMRVGFSEKSADNRIRQYEIGKMEPRADLLSKIADALNVEPTILFTQDYPTISAIQQIFFDLEKIIDLTIDKKDGEFVLRIDKESDYYPEFQELLSNWYYAKQHLLPSVEYQHGLDQTDSYDLWQYAYPVLQHQRELLFENQVVAKYDFLLSKMYQVETYNQYMLCLGSLYGHNLHVHIERLSSRFKVGMSVSRISLYHEEILSLTGEDAQAYTAFRGMMKCLMNDNAMIEIETHTFEGKTCEDFVVYDSPLTTMNMIVKKYERYFTTGEFIDDKEAYEYKSDFEYSPKTRISLVQQ